MTSETAPLVGQDAQPAAFLLVGLHGVLSLRPEVAQGVQSGAFDDDVFSLAVRQSEALGLATTGSGVGGGSSPVMLWAHNDAGQEWTQDDQARQVAWLQVSPRIGTMPIEAVASVLADVIEEVGELTLTGLHVVVTDCPAAPDVPEPSDSGKKAARVLLRSEVGRDSLETDLSAVGREGGGLVISSQPPSTDESETFDGLQGVWLATTPASDTVAVDSPIGTWGVRAAVGAAQVAIASIRERGDLGPVAVLVTESESATS